MKISNATWLLQKAEIHNVRPLFHCDFTSNRYTVKKISKNWLANFPMMQIEPLMVTKIKKRPTTSVSVWFMEKSLQLWLGAEFLFKPTLLVIHYIQPTDQLTLGSKMQIFSRRVIFLSIWNAFFRIWRHELARHILAKGLTHSLWEDFTFGK